MNLALVKIDRGTGSYFCSYILSRIEKNKNFLGAITGSTGSGKSYSALSLGETLDPDFNVLNVCFTPKEFMDLINGKTKQLKKGCVIIFDEIQVSMSHLEYQSIQAKVLNYIFQTFRYRNFILFMTSPHFSFINASLRKLFHSRIETVSIDNKTNLCKLKPMLIQVNQKTGDIYEKYLRVYDSNYGMIPIKEMHVRLPSDKLIVEYEAKKDIFSKALNKSISKDLQRIEDKDKGIVRKPLTDMQERVFELLMQNKNAEQVAKELGKGLTTIYDHIRAIEKKGIIFEPVKDGSNVLYYTIKGEIEHCNTFSGNKPI